MKQTTLIIIVATFMAACNRTTNQVNVNTSENRLKDSLQMAKQKSVSDSIAEAEKIAFEKWEKTPAGKIHKKHPDWSTEDCDRLARKEIWIGMRIGMVYQLYGLPDDINVSDYGSGPEYQYCWPDNKPGYFYTNADRVVKSYN